MTSHLFVYGTLLSGMTHPMHDVLSQYAELLGRGYINGKLYDLGNYPGLVLSNNQQKRVWGEIYHIREENELFRYLDDYEGCGRHSPRPHEYQRDMVSIHDSEEHGLLAWTYLYKRPVRHLPLIPHGDYLYYRNKGHLKLVNS